MSSKTHNKHIKLDTNLTKRSSDPDYDREISNEKIDIYELCIHPIHYSLTLYPYMYDLSRHHSYYNTSTFTQTYWKDHLIEITIERARTKTSRSASSVYTQYITHSLSIHICMIFLDIIHITTHPHLHKHIEKIIWSR